MIKVIGIGASAGGVEALKKILPSFKRPSQMSVMVVLHIPPKGPNLLPAIYQELCDFKIKEAESGEKLLPETIYVAPPDYHMCAEVNGTISLNAEPLVNYSRPSIDMTLESIAFAYGEKSLGIVLTGSNHDGTMGLYRIHEDGGITVVQDPDQSEYSTMPGSCLSKFKPDYVLNLDEISNSIVSWNFVRRTKWIKRKI